MRRVLVSLALLATIGARPGAQEVKPTVLVYPFGIASAARAGGTEVAAILAARALEGVLETDRLTAINESANPVLKSQLEGAMTLAQFESAVKLKTDQQLQSQYMLTGFIQSSEATPSQGRGNEVVYQANLTAIVQLYDVQTRAVKFSKEITLSNSLVTGGRSRNCSGIKGRLRCAAEDAAALGTQKKLESSLGGAAGDAIKASTAQEAMEAALRNAPSAIAKLLNENLQ
jgi:hypothetical protein